MTDHTPPPVQSKEIPPDELKRNSFSVLPNPIDPHVCLWVDEGGKYQLHVYADRDGAEVLLKVALSTLVQAEAEFSFDERDADGRLRPDWMRESNAEIERKAQELEAMAGLLRRRHLRPAPVSPEGTA